MSLQTEIFCTRTYAFLAVAMLLSLVLAGCVTQSASAPSTLTKPSDQAMAMENLSNTTNKTGHDQTQEQIALAVADGTYVENRTYAYHSGTETVEFHISVQNDIVTAVDVQAEGTPNPISAKIIGNFATALPDLVVGKKITELDLPKNVAGSSLTNAAFQAYVDDVIAKY